MRSYNFSYLLLTAVLSVSVHSAEKSQEPLHLDFDDKAHPGLQPSPLPPATVEGDVVASQDFPGAVDLGASGYLVIPGFKSPQGPFSVEARFLIREYAPLSTRYISDILNTATWDTGPTQGLTFRVGGGYLYAPMPRSSYASDSDYAADVGWYVDSDRAEISKCIGEFLTAIKGQDRIWKEVVTDRCLPRNAWVHMVGVYDGRKMHIYLNGQYATDTLRVLNQDSIPVMDSTATAFVGARTSGSYDSRHMDGTIDYIRVVDSAMGSPEIRRRYRETLTGVGSDTLCYGTIIPEYPNAGQAVNEKTRFSFRIVANGACTEPGFSPEFNPGDSVEVEIASDIGFEHILVRMIATGTSFKIDPGAVVAVRAYKGEAYWRARLLRPASPLLGKGSALTVPDWSLARPLMVDLPKPTGAMHRGVSGRARVTLLPGSVLSVPARGASVPAFLNLDGSRSRISWVRTGDRWTARIPQDREARLLFLGWE